MITGLFYRSCVSYSSSGQHAVIGSLNSMIELYSFKYDASCDVPEIGDCLGTFTGHINEKSSLNCSINCIENIPYIISASEDNKVCS
jgi:hypothetical protein